MPAKLAKTSDNELNPITFPDNIEEIVKEWEGKRAPPAIREQLDSYKAWKARESKKLVNQAKSIQQISELDRFLEAFIKNGGNATQAALSLGKQYSSITVATAAGGELLKQARGMARAYLEKKGFGYGKMMEVAVEKMMKSNKTDWWDRLMKMAEYEDFTSTKSQQPTIGSVTIWAAHKDIASQYVQGEEVQEGEVVKDKDK